MEDFIVKDNIWAFNKKHLRNFGYTEILDKPKWVTVYVRFKDGAKALFMRDKNEQFQEKTKHQLRDFLETNGIKPTYGASKDEDISDTLIDLHLNGYNAVVPALKSNDKIDDETTK